MSWAWDVGVSSSGGGKLPLQSTQLPPKRKRKREIERGGGGRARIHVR